MDSQTELRFVNKEGAQRLRTVAVSILVSLLALTILITATYYLIIPDHGWISALGVGFSTSLWLCVFVGAVAGNGIHEIRREKSEIKEEPELEPTVITRAKRRFSVASNDSASGTE